MTENEERSDVHDLNFGQQYTVRTAGRDALIGWIALCKIMIPVSLFVSFLEWIGAIPYLSVALEPLMGITGLPGECGIIWAIALLVNIYAALAAFSTLAATGVLELTVAQASTLGSLILFAHGLLVEGAIARNAGLKFYESCMLRVGAALMYGSFLHNLYHALDLFQEPAAVRWTAPVLEEPGIAEWLIGECRTLLFLLFIVVILHLVIWGARRLGVVSTLERFLRPLLGSMGIGPSATFFVVIGLILGISYGGAILFAEVNAGRINANCARRSMILLCLVHSIFEDTLLMALIGGEIFSLLILRSLFSIILMLALFRVSAALHSSTPGEQLTP